MNLLPKKTINSSSYRLAIDNSYLDCIHNTGANCNNALIIASHEGNAEVVKVLLAAKDIDVNKGMHRRTALDIATENNHTEIIQLLIDAGGQEGVGDY